MASGHVGRSLSGYRFISRTVRLYLDPDPDREVCAEVAMGSQVVRKRRVEGGLGRLAPLLSMRRYAI